MWPKNETHILAAFALNALNAIAAVDKQEIPFFE
jgi:hypothetical protein